MGGGGAAFERHLKLLGSPSSRTKHVDFWDFWFLPRKSFFWTPALNPEPCSGEGILDPTPPSNNPVLGAKEYQRYGP